MQHIIFFINKHWLLSVIWLFFLIVIIFLITKNFFLKSKIISTFQAIKLINRNNAIVIDTRSVNLFRQGHIVNSINIPLKNIFLGQLKAIESYKCSYIILILNSSYQYNKCINVFLKYEFNNIFILKNGIHYWNLYHLPLIINDK